MWIVRIKSYSRISGGGRAGRFKLKDEKNAEKKSQKNITNREHKSGERHETQKSLISSSATSFWPIKPALFIIEYDRQRIQRINVSGGGCAIRKRARIHLRSAVRGADLLEFPRVIEAQARQHYRYH